jgi:hypothetical protein
MSWRILVESVVDKSYIIQQDYDLINYIKNNNITEYYGHNADYFRKFVKLVDYPASFGICIINKHFYFKEVVAVVNDILSTKIEKQGVLYLAINKFLADPICLQEYEKYSYDEALKCFLSRNISAKLISSFYLEKDDGNYFNFVHPLNRFYFQK